MKKATPQLDQYFKDRAEAKRLRKGNKPGATKYSIANRNRKS